VVVNTPTDVGDAVAEVEFELPQPAAASSTINRIARFINVSVPQNQTGASECIPGATPGRVSASSS
jgi:hypothetical protein